MIPRSSVSLFFAVLLALLTPGRALAAVPADGGINGDASAEAGATALPVPEAGTSDDAGISDRVDLDLLNFGRD